MPPRLRGAASNRAARRAAGGWYCCP